ncbi:hypothetical protein HDU93_000838 [Gonapodya sp. JEL0774]|nr:hypothetical protein HDU93_000838 [Gonapodya sp. JEL0774]
MDSGESQAGKIPNESTALSRKRGRVEEDMDMDSGWMEAVAGDTLTQPCPPRSRIGPDGIKRSVKSMRVDVVPFVEVVTRADAEDVFTTAAQFQGKKRTRGEGDDVHDEEWTDPDEVVSVDGENGRLSKVVRTMTPKERRKDLREAAGLDRDPNEK